jgi:hypothetical protein
MPSSLESGVRPRFNAHHAGGEAGGMPVHAHNGAEGLEPKGMREPAQKLVAAKMMNDGFGDHRAKPRHALRQPRRDVAVMERQIGASTPTRHGVPPVNDSPLC